MSIESAKAFIKRMKTDEEFAKKIMAETSKESRMAVACGEGFTFTEAEIEQIGGEMTDDELDHIVGGGAGNWGTREDRYDPKQ